MMRHDGISTAKQRLRQEVRAGRAARTPDERREAAEGVRIQLDALLLSRGARFVACYLSTPTEPGTRLFLTDALARGVRILLPLAREDGLLDWAEAVEGHDEMVGIAGTPEPTGPRLGPEALDEVDLVIAPAAAVDETGMRLGWGKGYYDRTIGALSLRPPVFAVVHDDEIVAAVPSDAHDQPVTGAVTPRRTLLFAPAHPDR